MSNAKPPNFDEVMRDLKQNARTAPKPAPAAPVQNPFGFGQTAAPMGEQQEIAEESFDVIGKAVRGVASFFMAEDNESFLRDVDAKHGTQLGAMYQKYAPAMGANLRPEIAPGVPDDDLGTGGPSDASGGSDDEVVIVVQDEEVCEFCKGKQVIAMHPRQKTRTPIACPTCKKNPSTSQKKNARQLGR